MGSQNYTDITYLVQEAQKSKKADELLETSIRWTTLIAIFISFSILLNFYLKDENKRHVIASSQVLGAARPAASRRLVIPQIDINADIKSVGVTSDGAMEVPNNAADVGLFKLGPRPGQEGSAVISGHVDSQNGEAAVFANLYKLKKGDNIYIQDTEGTAIAYVVRESRIYTPGYADEVFSQGDGAHLNLITCDGTWDGAKKSYTKRLVVFADIAH